MRHIKYMLSFFLFFLLSSCHPAALQKASPNLILENMVEQREKPSYSSFYQEVETSTYYKGKLVGIQLLKVWEDTVSGVAKYELIDSEEGTFYILMTNRYMTIYKKGNLRATIKPITKQPTDSLFSYKNDVIQRLESLRSTHKVRLKGESKVGKEDAYHIIAIPRDENHILGEQHLWISQKTWVILKQSYKIEDKYVVVRLKKFLENPRISQDILLLPDFDHIVFQHEPKYFERMISNDKFASLDYLKMKPNNQIKIYKAKELISPKKGIQVLFLKDGKEYFQLKAIEMDSEDKNVFQPKLESTLRIFKQPVYIQPIPSIGMELTWVWKNKNYELLYFDPFATKQELNQLLKRFY
ncbi:LolA-like protein [Bacillus massilinigeriensis]|uniref:hypothetical protein n=1 Tax=Bacillus massilionigeriensis TaxID=1805475 RepID=UPI00096B4E93|nr:hypothetical protein [Bacillus massilionigeriensis]